MAWAEISHINEGSPNTLNFTSSAISTLGANLIVITQGYYTGGLTPGLPSDNQGNTYTLISDTPTGLNGVMMAYKLNPTTSATHTFTTNCQNCYPVMQVIAFSDSATSPLDQTATSTTTGTAGPITPTQNDELILSASSSFPIATPLTCTSLTLVEYGLPFVGGQHIGSTTGYYFQTTATTVSATWSGYGGSDKPISLMSFKKAVATGTIIINSMFF